ncbi:uncharacterized protein F4812DRAFT_453352 [Daldinia caldariorum]|uniref:uncharacterized protein n=1 Tax=Daldinia caldariorum TaxID=326644 RepID=UPI0020083201|nr:uncharacterized protein F4812DRAFT_453352 [Daldinia caldariorum]KAI1463816.1 hypothetical protein F4812DRAFT_453352 [Daldinia caldariorum]
MGRTEPSVGRPPASFRRDARAKRAKATINKVIPPLLAAHPRARKGIEASELIVDPPPSSSSPSSFASSALASQGKTQQRVRAGSTAGESNGRDKSQGYPRISLRVADALEAAHSLLLVPEHAQSRTDQQRRDLSNTAARVGVLNMASPLSAGGGFLNGASSQEESLCMRSTLLPSLRDGFYRLPELGVVFTPDVAGEDDEVLPKRDRWFVDVASAAMIRMPEIDVDEESGFARYANAADRELAVRKVRAVLRVFASKGVRRVVLGAWGCGAYGNPVGEIAKAWRKKKRESDSDSWECFEHVVFAIKDPGMAQAFATAFGEEFLEVQNSGEGEDSVGSEDEGDDEEEDASVKELRNKIRELELRTKQARNPQLKAGLSSVLASLRSQLPDSNGIPSREDLVGSKCDRDNGSTSEEDEEESAEQESESDDETRSGHDEES